MVFLYLRKMNNNIIKKVERDDNLMNRLFLLFIKNGYHSVKVNRIAKYVYSIMQNEKNLLIVKVYKNYNEAKRVSTIYKKLSTQLFQYTIYPISLFNHEEIVDLTNYYALIFPFLNNGHVPDFSKESSCKMATKTVFLLHSSLLKMPDLKMIAYPINVEHKWNKRISLFWEMRDCIRYFIGKNRYDEILALSTFILDLKKLEQPNESIDLLHGDLVPHNFLQLGSKCFIIDLDNLSQGPISYEYSVLGQHILNENNWKTNVLFKLEPFTQLRNDKFFWRCMLFPNDLLREWEHLWRNHEANKKDAVEKLIQYTIQSLKERNEFVEFGKNMVI